MHKVTCVPEGSVFVRAWDLASEEPSDKNRYPDYTASVKLYKTKSGEYIIKGDYEPDSFDEKTSIYGRYQQRSGQRNLSMVKQAEKDGTGCTVILPVDPAAAGKVQFQELAKMFISKGFLAKRDPMPYNKAKLVKFEPFSSACQNGLVSIIESSFHNPQTLNAFYKELESFDGERSSASRKDDWPDVCGSAFNFLCQQRVTKKYAIPSNISDTALSKHRQLVN